MKTLCLYLTWYWKITEQIVKLNFWFSFLPDASMIQYKKKRICVRKGKTFKVILVFIKRF